MSREPETGESVLEINARENLRAWNALRPLMEDGALLTKPSVAELCCLREFQPRLL